MKRGRTGILLLLSTIFLSACTHVAPYEKEVLATQKMLSNPLSERTAFESHIYPIREGTSGAESGFQGGCGCK